MTDEEHRGRLMEIALSGVTEDGTGYIRWDKLRHLTPPRDFTHEE